MMHAQQNIRQFQGDNEFEWKAWLRAILGNDIRKSRRTFSSQKRNTKLEINLQEQSAVGRGLQAGELTPRSDAIQQETTSAIYRALSQLPEDQRQIIRLRNFDQLGFEEIGAQMDRSGDACRKMWARAIELLKQILKAEAPGLIDE
jgi:RNA polymerase sigma-70 factor (subfamily 1)